MKPYSLLRKPNYWITGFLIFIVIFLILKTSIKPEGFVLEENWELELNGQKTEVEIPGQMSVETLTMARYINTFNIDDASEKAIVISRIPGNALKIFLNGNLIGSIGDANNPTARFWNMVQIFPAFGNLKQGSNTLVIEQYTNITHGMTSAPMILDYQRALSKTNTANFFYVTLIRLMIGAGLLVGTIMLLIAALTETGKKTYILMGCATVFASIYCIDYLYFEHLFNQSFLLLSDKILLLSGFLALNIFTAGVNNITINSRVIRYTQYPLSIIPALLFLFSPTLPELIRFFHFVNPALIINGVFIAVMLLHLEEKDYIMLIPSILILCTVGNSFYVSMINPNAPYTIQYGALFSTVFFSADLIIKYTNIHTENSKLRYFAQTDPLTGAFNRNIIESIKRENWTSAIVVDFDNFKEYNDNFGHKLGDELLCSFVNRAKENLRTSDLVIRIGGDEFLILLKENDAANAETIIRRIHDQFYYEYDAEFSYGVQTIEHDITNSFHKADISMYQNKRARKKRNTPS